MGRHSKAVDDVVAPVSRTRAHYDLVTMILALWMVGGVFVDGWAHIILPSTKETFFTPWHGVLYSGFVAVAAWMTAPLLRSRPSNLAAAVRPGYGLAFVGLFIFGAGGIGDGIWHEIFGIEVGVDALLSPTHLMLLTGGILVLTSPLRAAWGEPETSPGLVSFLPVLLSVTLTAALLSFFFAYAWGGLDLTPARVVPAAALDEHAAGHRQAELLIAAGILARLATTALLIGPLLLLIRRWRPPAGTATFLFSVVSALLFALSDDTSAALLTAPLLAGVAADLWITKLERPAAPQWWAYGLAGAAALILWSTHFAAMAFTHGVGWTPELWGGAIVLAVLTAVGMAVLAFPPRIPALADEHQGPAGERDDRTDARAHRGVMR